MILYNMVGTAGNSKLDGRKLYVRSKKLQATKKKRVSKCHQVNGLVKTGFGKL